jgi:REP element-mobilizing transposase RayT
MPRSPRANFSGVIYHVTSRGNERRTIFKGKSDYANFLRLIGDSGSRYNLVVHAYCLMPNHYHLVLETPDANLSRAMQQINGSYGQYFNRRHSRVGHLFQGRFKAVLVEKQNHLLELTRYVVLNPVRSGIVDDPHAWSWSSFKPTVGASEMPDFLYVGDLLRCFDDDLHKARNQYIEFVLQGIHEKDGCAECFQNLPALGGSKFLERYKKIIEDECKPERELMKKNRFAGRPALSSLFKNIADRQDRDDKIRSAHLRYGYTMSEIARCLGMHRTSISRVIGGGKMRQFTV